MNEAVVHRHVRGEVIALRRRVFDLPMVGHSFLQCCILPGRRGLAQLSPEGNGANRLRRHWRFEPELCDLLATRR
jgi:hypothetical protein